jgi:hypothetical protein
VLEFGQTVSLLLDLRLDVSQFVHGLRVSQEILPIDIGGNPLLLHPTASYCIRVLGVSYGSGMRLIAMGDHWLVILRLDIREFGHQMYELLILLLRIYLFNLPKYHREPRKGYPLSTIYYFNELSYIL